MRSPAAMEQDEEEKWRDEAEEASSAVETGCCSSQSIPFFAHALSILNSFPTPPHEALFAIPCAAAAAPPQPTDPRPRSSSQGLGISIPCSSSIPMEPCAKNEENDKSNTTKCLTHNSSSEQQSSKKMRSKNWTRAEMVRLIGLRAELEARFCGGGKKTELWEEIAEALNREGIARDGQQCRDKWEKLCASYKDVRDGSRLKEDFTLYEVLHPVLSGRVLGGSKLSSRLLANGSHAEEQQQQQEEELALVASHPQEEEALNLYEDEVLDGSGGNGGAAANNGGGGGAGRAASSRKKRKLLKYVPVADVAVVQSLVEMIVAKQQRFFRELLESIERREQKREQMRQEREERWRAEDREQRAAFNSAMVCLAQKLVGNERLLSSATFDQQLGQCGNKFSSLLLQQQRPFSSTNPGAPEGGGVKKRSKNWKRVEVLQLIKLRSEMDAQFSSGTRRAAVWDELSEALMAQGVSRDGKQCREKWDKLTAAFKDVSDGVKDPADMPYFAELSAALKKPVLVEVPPAGAAEVS